MYRPTHREIDRKLAAAKEALATGRALFANPAKSVGELMALSIGDSEELWPLLVRLLNEIARENYAGSSPPMKAYEKAIAGSDLFAFAWESRWLGMPMYVKFALKEERFYLVSLHKSSPRRAGKVHHEVLAVR